MLIHENALTKRFIAYGLLIHGIVRLFAGIMLTQELLIIVSISYFIEAFYVENERWGWKTMVNYKATFVSISSIILGCCFI